MTRYIRVAATPLVECVSFLFLLVVLTWNVAACAPSKQGPNAQSTSGSNYVSVAAPSAPVYDCYLAASHAARALVGGPELHFQFMRNGYVANTRSGSLYLELSSCIDGSRADVVQYRWINQRIPIALTFPAGPVRSIWLTRSSARVTLKIIDKRGRKAILATDKHITDMVCYCRSATQNLILNFVQPERPDKSVDYISIVDSESGPVLRNETAP